MFAKLGFGTLASAAAGLMMMGSAQAITLTVVAIPDQATATAVQAAFQATGNLAAFEGFEGYAQGSVGDSLLGTNVGDFTVLTPPSDPTDTLLIGQSPNGPSGRLPVGGNNWLDNGDAEAVRWDITPTGGDYVVGFFVADPSDQGGVTTITAYNGLSVTLDEIFQNLPNGSTFFITVSDPTGIARIDYVVVDNFGDDGWGIDNVSIIFVPEPTTMALFGAGLLGLGLYRRRRTA